MSLTGSWFLRSVEAEPTLDRRPTEITLFLPDYDHGKNEQPDQTDCDQQHPGDARSQRIRMEIGGYSGEYDPTQDAHREGSQGPNAEDLPEGVLTCLRVNRKFFQVIRCGH